MPFNIPIALTWLRIILIPVFVAVYYLPDTWLMTTGPKNSLTSAARAIAGLIVAVADGLVRKGTWRAPPA